MVWHEVVGTLKETGGNASISNIPNGFADYEYLIPTHENIKIRIENTIEDVVIHHIVAIGLMHDVLGAGGVVLSNVDNTSDANKPISIATQTALDIKANQATTYTKSETDSKIAQSGGVSPAILDTINNAASSLASQSAVVTALADSVALKANVADVYTKAAIDALLANQAFMNGGTY